MRDISEGGARLIVETPLGIPDEFTLTFNDGCLSRHCRVAWRKAGQIEVEFS